MQPEWNILDKENKEIMSKKPSDQQREVETIVGLMIDRYKLKLTESELEEVKSNTEFIVETHWKFRDVKLDNGIAPMSIFTPNSLESADVNG